ncbi:MAG: hypothetical protein WCI88_16410 [Chloroflexota bacterium]
MAVVAAIIIIDFLISFFLRRIADTGQYMAATTLATKNAKVKINGSSKVRNSPCCFAPSDSGSE